MKYFKTYITYIYILLSDVKSYFWTPYTCLTFQQKHIQNPFKHLGWSILACQVNDFKLLTVCAKTLHFRCLNGFGICVRSNASKSVLCHHDKRLMGYFEFLYGSMDILLSFEYSRKIALTTSLRKARRGRDSSSLS